MTSIATFNAPPYGRSGASLAVVKSGTDEKITRRLRAQYRWLKRFSHNEGIVGVYREVTYPSPHEYGYEMELLTPIPMHKRSLLSDLEPYVSEVLPTLHAVWQCGNLGTSRMCEWHPICEWPEGGPDLHGWWYQIVRDYGRPDECETHGDPTMENVLLRGKRRVLVDPLPDVTSDGRAPSCRALDMGKVLQSLIGYERIRWMGDEPTYPDAVLVHKLRERCTRDCDWHLACWACLFHVRRLIPYQEHMMQFAWLKWLPRIEEMMRELAQL